jgi:four helix bundle protein
MEKIYKKEIYFKEFGFESLTVYRKAFQLSMDIYEVSKSFPREELYSLTDQIRRSSRSVSANLAEGYRKRIYPKHFSSKMIDCDGECSETIVHLKFAYACNYITLDQLEYFDKNYDEVGRILSNMAQHPEKFLPKNQPSKPIAPDDSNFKA